MPACCLEAAGGGPCIPLTSRILKDRSKPWQGTARANSYVFHGGKYRNWDEVSTANAVEAVLRGESVHRAAELYIRERRPRNAIQLCCTTNRFSTSHRFYSICRAHLIPVPVLSAMKHVGISSGSSLERSFRILLASGIQGPPPAASKQHAGKAELTGTGLGFQHVTEI